jgi:hypothetical protein
MIRNETAVQTIDTRVFTATLKIFL